MLVRITTLSVEAEFWLATTVVGLATTWSREVADPATFAVPTSPIWIVPWHIDRSAVP